MIKAAYSERGGRSSALAGEQVRGFAGTGGEGQRGRTTVKRAAPYTVR